MMNKPFLLFCLILLGCSSKTIDETTTLITDIKPNQDIPINKSGDTIQNTDHEIVEIWLSVEEEIRVFVKNYRGEADFENNYILAHRESDLINHIEELSVDAKNWIKEFGFSPNNESELLHLHSLESLRILYLSGRSLNSIDGLEGLILEELKVTCPIYNIDSITSMNSLRKIDLTRTLIANLPNMSEMISLVELDLKKSSIKSLDNIETIPTSFFLYLRNCNDLTDIDALRFSNVSGILIDNKDVAPQWVDEGEEGTYNRFEDWFDRYLPEILERNPDFKIYFDVDDLYGNPISPL